MCQACDTFDSRVAIHWPQQLRTLVRKVRAAIESGTLRCNELESSRALVGQASFATLELDTTIADVMRYYFECESCGAAFGLFVEDGSGGEWSKL